MCFDKNSQFFVMVNLLDLMEGCLLRLSHKKNGSSQKQIHYLILSRLARMSYCVFSVRFLIFVQRLERHLVLWHDHLPQEFQCIGMIAHLAVGCIESVNILGTNANACDKIASIRDWRSFLMNEAQRRDKQQNLILKRGRGKSGSATCDEQPRLTPF